MRIRIFCLTLFLLMLNVAELLAQGEPCDGTDPDIGFCPLDTWVLILAVISVAFGALYLYNKQKSPLQNTEGIK